MMEHIIRILPGTGILILLVGVWFFVYLRFTPWLRQVDGRARITGSCGDTMEISLKFDGDRVVESAYWTDGCAYSLNCVYAAATLARGRTPDEILEIDPELIGRSVGGLPEDHMHCARLSAETLYGALHDSMMRGRGSG